VQRYENNLIKQAKSMIFRTSLIQFNNIPFKYSSISLLVPLLESTSFFMRRE